jgi:hypothetical protein
LLKGIILENHKKINKIIMTTKGELTIYRTALRIKRYGETEEIGKKIGDQYVIPLDIILGIDALPFKMTREMMCEVAFWAQNQTSFKAAEKILKKTYCVNINSETIRQVADYVGKIIFDEDTKESDIIYKNMTNTKFSNDKEGILYIQMDGAALNTRKKDEDGSTWRENKLGIVFSSDNIRTSINKKGEKVSHILKKEYTSYVGSVDKFKKYIYACAIKNGYGKYRQIVILSDGATWIRNMCEELFPDAIQILDLYHLCENIYNYAKAIYKNDESKYKPWSEEVIKKVRESKTEEVLVILKKLKNRKIPKGVVNLYTYITNNIDKIDYKSYKENGYYVGSGVIESGNKVVLQKRLKLAGMRWNESTAQYLLTLRSKIESGLWSEQVCDKILNYSFHNLGN